MNAVGANRRVEDHKKKMDACAKCKYRLYFSSMYPCIYCISNPEAKSFYKSKESK